MASSLGVATAKLRRCSLPLNAAKGRHSFFAAAAPPSAPLSSSASFYSSTSTSSFSASPPPTVALRAALAYDGSGFSGFQLQTGSGGGGSRRKKGGGAPRTVQGEIEKALLTVSSGRGGEGRGGGEGGDERARRAALRLHAAGRTDAGVHARGQVISFALPAGGGGQEENFFDEERLVALERSLNRLLPGDVRLRALERCPPDFSARFSALGKHYSFTVLAGAEPDPLTRRHSHFERRPRERRSWPSSSFSSSSSSSSSSLPPPLSLLDVDSMREAAAHFVGQRDFTHFASINASHPASDPVRLIERASVSVLAGAGGGDDDDDEAFDAAAADAADTSSSSSSSSSSSPSSYSSSTATPPPRSLRLRFDFQGDGFLYRQVRHMSGALIAVGLDRLSPSDILEKLERGRGDPPLSSFRGWTVADAAGLCLERAFYPSYDDFRVPIHGDLPHDEFGRVSLEALSERSNRGRQRSNLGGNGSSCASSSPSLDEELRGVKAARRRAAGMPATGSDLLEKEKRGSL